MKVDRIPRAWKNPDGGRTHNLTNPDLPVAATFVSDDMGLKITLLNSESRLNQQSGMHERVDGTGCRLCMRGGRLQVHNKKLLQILMASSAFQNGKIRMDEEDPTGFWRQAGNLTVREVTVTQVEDATMPNYKNLDFDNIKKPKEAPAPVAQAGTNG